MPQKTCQALCAAPRFPAGSAARRGVHLNLWNKENNGWEVDLTTHQPANTHLTLQTHWVAEVQWPRLPVRVAGDSGSTQPASKTRMGRVCGELARWVMVTCRALRRVGSPRPGSRDCRAVASPQVPALIPEVEMQTWQIKFDKTELVFTKVVM